MKKPLKIRAGALQFVLFISVVLAILLLAFVSLSHVHTLFDKKTALSIQTTKAAQLGVAMLLSTKDSNTDLSNTYPNPETGIALKGTKQPWGVFRRYQVSASAQKHRHVQQALVGGGDPKRSALYLKDQQKPLILAGDAKITGKTLLPKAGIRAGNIGGHSYYHSALVYGVQGLSSDGIPALSPIITAHLDALLSGTLPFQGSNTVTLTKGMTLGHSFSEPTLIMLEDFLELENVSLKGNIIITASKEIRVSSTAILKDVILVAPKIKVMGGVKGTFQAIGGESIEVGSGVELAYPSALIVKRKKLNTQKNAERGAPSIYLAPRSQIRGIIAYLDSRSEAYLFPQIKIDSKAQVIGEIYCEHNLELKGIVYGSVITQAFMAQENGNTYQNHLFNGQINSSFLPPQFVGLEYEFSDNNQVAKWLY